MEDKDRGDFLFLDLPSLPLSKQSRPTDPLIETLPKLPNQPKLVLPDQLEPVPENQKSAPENVRFDKMFSRKKIVVPESVQDLPIAVRKGIRECTNQPLYPLTHFLSFKKISPSHRVFLVSLNTISIPTTVSEALTNEKWKQAMNVKMGGIRKKNKTWELVKLSAGKNLVGFAKMNTVRVLLSLAANYDWDLQQFDVKNAFLHGELEEEIYMEVLPGYDNNLAAHIVSLLVYVDDIIVTGNDDKERQVLNQCLAKEFEIKALGRLKYFLGIEVAHSKQGIFISQQNPKEAHLQVAYRVLQYLKGTPGQPLDIAPFLVENLVTGRSKKQNVVARSSAEAEFRAMARVCVNYYG
ncbi:hypothetical protein CK203_027993 [Vitis vinifera]|uniref:Reverse transcriptase Ty1/copia-type domain-containing protein n=1 Tax=Vitis vinifera TaxID=29760 RepID=A0A438ILM8_VITVI|nr:hypothetical protein CK203_027993 [Vitis vinifera]